MVGAPGKTIPALFSVSLKVLAKLKSGGLEKENVCLAYVRPWFHSPEVKSKLNCTDFSRNSPYTIPVENVEP